MLIILVTSARLNDHLVVTAAIKDVAKKYNDTRKVE